MVHAALLVLTDRMVFTHIVDFLPGVPCGLLTFQVQAYESHGKDSGIVEFYPPHATPGAALLHHALLTNNERMRGLLLRMRQQPHYAKMPLFVFDGVLELVCKRGSMKQLQTLIEMPGIVTRLPPTTLQTTLYACCGLAPTSALLNDQKEKALWLVKHHPAACKEVVELSGSLLKDKAVLSELLAAKVVTISDLAECEPCHLDAALLASLLPKFLTPKCLEDCARLNNLDAVKFIHQYAPERLFAPRVMDIAALGGAHSVVKFLHENRTEGCTSLAMEHAAWGLHLDVIRFLHETRNEHCTPSMLEAAARNWDADTEDTMAVVQYILPRCRIHDLTLVDPTCWQYASNEVRKYVCSVWAESAILGRDPVQELRGSVLKLTDVEAFKLFHNRVHAVACDQNRFDRPSVLRFAIDTGKIEFAIYLVESCAWGCASIGWDDLCAVAGSEPCVEPVNLELLRLMVMKGPRHENRRSLRESLLEHSAECGQLAVVKLLLELGVSCSDAVVTNAALSGSVHLVEYLVEKYPQCVTSQTLVAAVNGGNFEVFYKLHASYHHLFDTEVLTYVLLKKIDGAASTRWQLLQFVYEHYSATYLKDQTLSRLWTMEDCDDVAVFMWLVWRDPKIQASLAKARWDDRIRLYLRLLTCVPSLFAGIPASLPWCYQLRLLRCHVQFGGLTLADVDRARAVAATAAMNT